MKYAQIKSGHKLHLVYEAEGFVSQPICGIKAINGYRMTINASLTNACKRCLKIYALDGKKIKKEFLKSII